jgi:hypothetical protein
MRLKGSDVGREASTLRMAENPPASPTSDNQYSESPCSVLSRISRRSECLAHDRQQRSLLSPIRFRRTAVTGAVMSQFEFSAVADFRPATPKLPLASKNVSVRNAGIRPVARHLAEFQRRLSRYPGRSVRASPSLDIG